MMRDQCRKIQHGKVNIRMMSEQKVFSSMYISTCLKEGWGFLDKFDWVFLIFFELKRLIIITRCYAWSSRCIKTENLGDSRQFIRRFFRRSRCFFWGGGFASGDCDDICMHDVLFVDKLLEEEPKRWVSTLKYMVNTSMKCFGRVDGSHQRVSCAVINGPEYDIEERFPTDSSLSLFSSR